MCKFIYSSTTVYKIARGSAFTTTLVKAESGTLWECARSSCLFSPPPRSSTLMCSILSRNHGPPLSDLTDDMLVDGAWKNLDFKSFNLSALGTALECGTLHPLLKVRRRVSNWLHKGACCSKPKFSPLFSYAVVTRSGRSTDKFSSRWALRRCLRSALWRGVCF
jgi:hypothetical protein